MLKKKVLNNVENLTKKLDQMILYVFTFPLILLIGLVMLYPLCYAVFLSFYQGSSFVGLTNYIKLYNDKYFWHSLQLTFIYVIVYTAGVFFVGFITALLTWHAEQTNLKGKGIIGGIITLPYVIPDVVASLLWLWMFTPSQGVINYILKSIGIIKSSISWVGNPSLALYSVLLVTIWRLFPLHTLIILAGFRSIPNEIFEAAKIDGAGTFRKFFSIMLPMTSSILSLLLLLTIVWSFKRFTIIWLMTGGGPNRASEITVIQIYREAFSFFNKNYASTIGTVMLGIVTIISVIYLKLRKER